MENCPIPSEIIAALIAVGGSVLTFLLASLFSMISRKMDFNQVLKKEILNKRFELYEDLVRWLPVENFLKAINNSLNTGLDSYADVFQHHFSEFAYFVLRARLYASEEVFRELVAAQEEYKLALSKALADKKVYQTEVHVVEAGDDIFDPLLDLGRRRANLLVSVIAKELAFDKLGKDKSKFYKERNEKS